MTSMPAKLKADWLAALRSGEYKQTTETLCDGTGYCCLGVLEMVAQGACETKLSGTSLVFPSDSFLREHSIHNDGDFTILAERNDAGDDFNDIADYIEDIVVGVGLTD